MTPGRLLALQRAADDVYVDPHVVAYAARLVAATRRPAEHGLAALAGAIAYGGSPRASINAVLAARALAFVRGRRYALPSDVAELMPDVLRHRLVLSYDGLAAGVTPEAAIAAVLEKYPPPHMNLVGRDVA
jgi:MoxR-like ATPase